MGYTDGINPYSFDAGISVCRDGKGSIQKFCESESGLESKKKTKKTKK